MTAGTPVLRTDVALCFKGDRAYIHGTDVYESAVALLRETWPTLEGRCRFMFHRLARSPLAAWFGASAAGAVRPEGCVAEMHVTGGRDEASIWFVERDGAVDCRYAYDEDAVVQDCEMAGTGIRMSKTSSARSIEVLVAMTKRLHYANLRPAAGRWLFVRLDLMRLLRPDDSCGMHVRLIGPARASLTRAEITVRDERIGSIYFSVGAP